MRNPTAAADRNIRTKIYFVFSIYKFFKEKHFGHGLLYKYSFRQRYTDLLVRHVNETKGIKLNYRRFCVECGLLA